MAQCLAINSNNDIYRGSNGNIVLLSGQSAVQTACATATKAQLGEMVYATTTGMPTFQAVWIGTPNINIYLNYLRQTILNASVCKSASWSKKEEHEDPE